MHFLCANMLTYTFLHKIFMKPFFTPKKIILIVLESI